ncbi:MAG: peptidyl-prolyl cis-trans isomerase [Candidatus Moduliflexus flocculans]|nr:peptidyl-prolyl cis-trans isomerase [Candidatus Moduliflexus flocculans]
MEWKASHILVKDRAQAQELLKRIKQGADFASLARENSTCPSKSSGGDLGWFGSPARWWHPSRAACKSLGVGSVSDVVADPVRLPPREGDRQAGLGPAAARRGRRGRSACGTESRPEALAA